MQTKPENTSSKPLAGSASLRGDIDAARAEGMDVTHWQIKQHLLKTGRAWTRQNFIEFNWQATDLPDEWDEGELPEDLQDWSAPAPTR